VKKRSKIKHNFYSSQRNKTQLKLLFTGKKNKAKNIFVVVQRT